MVSLEVCSPSTRLASRIKLPGPHLRLLDVQPHDLLFDVQAGVRFQAQRPARRAGRPPQGEEAAEESLERPRSRRMLRTLRARTVYRQRPGAAPAR